MHSKSRPFNYSLRVSARARHVRLAVKPYQGLEIVIPKRFPKKKIPRILQQHEAWITKQLKKHQNSLRDTPLPESIMLRLTDTTFRINYYSGDKPALKESHNELSICYQSKDQAVKLLRNWIRTKAKQILPLMLSEVASKFDFVYERTSIRSQKSRWGSCSSSGTISLNDQLLFMPADTVSYLLIHELCHTRHMNHSHQFWNLVENCYPDYKRHDHNLSKGREKVPAWFSQSLFSKS